MAGLLPFWRTLFTPRHSLTLAAVLLLPSGCGEEGVRAVLPTLPTPVESSGPTDHEIFQVQAAAAASGALRQAADAANDAIVLRRPGVSAPGPMGLPVFPGATPAFDYGADEDFIIDFDAVDSEGADLYPGARARFM